MEVATGGGGYGWRWLREEVEVARKTSTVWRAVATGGGGYGRAVTTTFCPTPRTRDLSKRFLKDFCQYC